MISKIAIFRALHLGDMLCIIPAVRSIRAAYPHAEIYLIGLPWQKDFVRRFSRYFNYYIEFPGWPGLPEQQADIARVFAFLNEIRRYEFDIIFQMQGNGVLTNSLCMLWNGKKVCGLRKRNEYAPYKELFPVSEDGEHEILRFMKLPECMSMPLCGTQLEFPMMEDEIAAAKSMLQSAGCPAMSYVCLHPGARDERRRWPVENFATVATHLAAHGYRILLTGSEAEETVLNNLQQRIQAPVLNIVERFGHVTAGELAWIIGHARLLVSNDTGVSHIAAALKVPSVIVFSMYSDINRWRPLDADLHKAVPFDETKNLEHVLQIISAKLHEPKEHVVPEI